MANKSELRKLATTFFLVASIIMSFAIIPACWMWPMYSVYKNKVQNDNEEHIGLAVCSLLFGGIFGIVAAILLFVSNTQTNSKGKSN